MALQRVRSNMLANNFVLDDDQGLIVGSGNNIYIDTVNNRVGINTNSPTHDFTVAGNIHATGNITAGGDITIGDSDTDTLTITAEIGSDILPDIDNTYDLGSAAKKWAEVHATTFYGDGSQLTGLSSTLDEVTTNGDTTTNSITVGGLIVNSTGALGLPIGTTAERPTAADGLIRFNSDLVAFEGYDGVEWGALGGGGATYSATAPTTNLKEGDLWFDTGTTGELYVYSGTEWLSVTGAGGSAFYQRGFLGDGSTTAFNVYGTGTSTVVVYINGVFVTTPADYSYANGVVTFVTPPALNDEINVLVYGETTGISLSLDSLTDVDLTTTAPTDSQVLVYNAAGNKFVPGDAAADFTDLTGSLALNQIPDGLITPAKLQTGVVFVDEFTADGNTASFTLSQDPGSAAAIQVFVDSVPQLASNYTVVGTTLTLPANPANGSIVEVRGYGAAVAVGTVADLSVTTNKIANGAVTAAKLDSAITTDDITEGSTNLYYTDARVDARVNAQTGTNLDLSNKSTTDLAEGTNLYYTDARVDARLAGGSVGNIVTTGYLAGPATFTIDPAAVGDNTGTVVIAGNLQVDGTTTTINSTTVTVDDLNLTLASGAINAAAANGAGITVDGAGAALTYNGTSDLWKFTKQLQIDPGYLTLGDTGGTDNSWINNLEDGNVEIVNQGRQSDAGGIRINRFNSPGGDTTYFRDFDVYDGKNSLVLKVDGSEGKVGIGIDNPQHELDLTKTLTAINNDPTLQIKNSWTGEGNNVGFSNRALALLSAGNDTVITKIQSRYDSGANYGEIGTTTSHDFLINTSGTPRIYVASGGNVGIGTGSISPSTTLEVAGTAKADQYLLDAIDATISATAVDVFVYDTRKDSDGGAWRKRTQHTSWYNETLNTATRGSRREFPAVAVIVASNASNTVTIYDGDDPNLPMWMVFDALGSNQSTIGWYTSGSVNLTSITAKNGILVTGQNGGILQIRFISDDFKIGYNPSYTIDQTWPIINRNEKPTSISSGGGDTLIDYLVNDVDITVLPNAPIDSATGLPVPTIAVATNNGTSVIRDDRTVGSLTGFAPVTHVTINPTTLAIYSNSSYTGYLAVGSSTVATGSADYNSVWRTNWSYEDNISSTPTAQLGESATFGALGSSNEIHAAGADGYNIFLPSVGETQDAIAYITSDYNTGWMNGDIKLATLSDTDDTDVTGTELVTNGTFDTDVSGWSNNATEILTWNSSGYAQVDRNGGSSQGQCYQNITTEVGKTYVAKVDVLAVSHGFQVYADQNTIPSTSTSGVVNTTGTFYWWFTASSTTTRIDLSAVQSTTATASFDNVSVKLAESDRSVNNKGLQVFGTVTKNPVATGADLVAYSGFSSSNYLQQPVNTDLHFGSADYCFMGWVKNSVSTQTQAPWELSMGSDGTGDPSILCYLSGGDVTFYTRSTSSSWISLSTPFSTDVWHQIVMVYRNGIKHLYLDGELKGTQAHSGTFSSSDSFFTVGYRGDGAGNPCLFCDISLVRISATAPSAEQIKKIYEDEKVLFQDNAKATLYGSSDAVTALAYDDSTNLLHVGTSSGRSVFQGLKRIDNTTDAVGSAISASNGLVAED